MALRQIDKPVVVHFLESTKEVLSHISAWTVELSTRGQEGGKSLNLIYGAARRLRDYLQRSLSGFPQPVKLDLSEADENVLVSCFLHSIGSIDGALLAKNVRTLSDRALLEQKRTVLGDWAVEFASRTPERIPVANQVEGNTPTTRGVLSLITKKLAAKAGPEKATDVPSIRVIPRGGDQNPTTLEPKPGDPPRLEIQTLRSALMNANGEACPPEADASEPQDKVEPAPAPALERSSLYPESVPERAPTDEIVDSKRIRDPRLRSMVTLDQRSFDRAMAASDFRLALVHLYSIFEAGIIDHGLAHRIELGLQGNVESWMLETILAKALGERFPISDRALMSQLVCARSLIRPALQIMSPLAVTHASLSDARALVRRVFVELGLSGSGSAGPGADGKTGPGLVAARGDGSGWSRS